MASGKTVAERFGRRVGAAGHALGSAALRAVTAEPVARAGHRVATAGAMLWGRMLRGRPRRVGALTVIDRLPSWAFGRGGTTVGAVFLTRDATSPRVLAHEDVHRRQWERYGLWFIAMYAAAGTDATRNRFEIEAGLEDGGYLPHR